MTRMRLICAAVCVLGLALSMVAPAVAQSVLKVQRGLASSDILVLSNRAIVVESDQPFTELSVAQPEIADVQPLSDRTIYVLGRRRGATTLTLLGEGGALISNVTIRVQPDLGELKQRFATLLPGEDIEVRTSGSGIILSGVVSGPAKIDRALSLSSAYVGNAVTNLLSVGGTQQVALKVRIAEISRSVGKDLGISTGLVGTSGRTTSFTQTGNSITNNLGDGNFLNPQPDPITGIPTNETPQFENLLGSFGVFGAVFSIADNYLLDLQIDAMEEKGFARMLAEPTLVALSGTEAEFLAGGEVPVPAVDDDGNVEVTFRPVGVNVIFQPQVVDDDLINLVVSAEVSDVDPSLATISGGLEITGFQVRRATTTIELRDGQSFAIAGLYEEEFSDTVAQVPWLGDIPVLGTLFRSTNFQTGESELVIIVTVNLVTPVGSIDELALPTDNIQIPNESELFLFGNTVAGGGAVITSTQGFDGDFGYAVE